MLAGVDVCGDGAKGRLMMVGMAGSGNDGEGNDGEVLGALLSVVRDMLIGI
jgi:hypothetical protein